MRRQVVAALWLLVVWVALWEDLSVGTVIGGSIVAVMVVRLVPTRRTGNPPQFRIGATIRLLFIFLRELMKASAVVAWEVITPSSRINEAIVAVPIRGVSNGITTLVANLITLTPGTVTIEVRSSPAMLYIHVLHLRSVEEVRTDVRGLEQLVIEAFAPRLADTEIAEGEAG